MIQICMEIYHEPLNIAYPKMSSAFYFNSFSNRMGCFVEENLYLVYFHREFVKKLKSS